MNRFFFVLCFSLASCTTPSDDTGPSDTIIDKDGDGFAFDDDCNDSNDSIYPGAPEGCEEPLVDSNCDGYIGGVDNDDDGYRACDDCDDGNDAIHPNALEICDGEDNDCNGLVDDEDSDVDLSTVPVFYMDTDEDGFGDTNTPVVQCAPPSNATLQDGDCDDSDPLVYPGAEEICDFKDNDCNGDIDRNDANVTLSDTDPTCYPDSDGDGFGDKEASGIHACFCDTEETEDDTDCDDTDNTVRPDADYSDTPAASGSWDLNCDGAEELEYSFVDAQCTLSSDGRNCKFREGYLSSTPPYCGESESYLSSCMIKKGTSGPYCELKFIDTIQRCR